MLIKSNSAQGLRIHEFLCKELRIPKTAQTVKVEYGVGLPFSVTVGYLPEQAGTDEIDVTSICSSSREYVAGRGVQ